MMPIDKRQYIDQKILGLMFEWGDLVLAAGAAVTLLLGALDYFVTPENFKQFFLYRLACASVLTLLIVVNKINKKRQNRGLQLALFTVATLTAGAMIELMIFSFGGHQSIYYTGMILLYIFCLGFVPLNSLRLSLTYASLAYGIYLVPLLLFDTITNTKVFLNSNIFLIASALSAVLWRHYNDRLLIKNFSLEYELSREKERLEEVVQEQTQDLKVSEHKLRALFENATDGILITDEQGVILEINKEASSIYGFTKDALIGTNLELLETDMNKTLFRERMKRLLKGEPLLFETKHYRKDGSKISLELGAKALHIADKILVQFFVRDITEKHMLQEQLVHSQKMESLGSLIGGIAHNFNNFLTAILGNVELIAVSGNQNEITAKRMKSIESAARKASVMLSTLLNFSRKETFQMFPLNLNDVVHEATKFLEGIIDKRIGIKLELADIRSIEGDWNRLEQILLNIIMNARDAMPDGGLITIKTSEIRIEKDRFDMPTYILPGSYILLSISDTGQGILPETLNRIFEPFFTTKKRGQGTGLGFSLVYRTVKDLKGYITVQSEVGKGSTFFIYLPVAGKDLDRSAQPEITFSPATQNILVIDDDEEVLELVKDILETHGYKVLYSLNPLSALDIVKNLISDLDLVITDIMMPLIDGKELMENLRAIKPDISIIAISAYSDDVLEKNSDMVDAFLQKPFEAAGLLSAVRKVLETKARNFPRF